MMEMSHELTASVLENAMKHGKFNIPLRNAIENAVRLLKPVSSEIERSGSYLAETCGECGTSLLSYWKFCPECGRGVKRSG